MKLLWGLLFTSLLAVSASADVIFGPAMAFVLAIHYWHVTLLVIAVIILTVILIHKTKKKGD